MNLKLEKEFEEKQRAKDAKAEELERAKQQQENAAAAGETVQ